MAMPDPLRLASLCVASMLIGAAALAEPILFRHVLDNSLLEVKLRPGEVETEAVKKFKESGTNPYNGDQSALAEGKTLYEANCQACHLPDGSGRIGPSLIGNEWKHRRAATDVGLFEIIYGGASGAMQSFARRGMKQDEMLKVMAYMRSLRKT